MNALVRVFLMIAFAGMVRASDSALALQSAPGTAEIAGSIVDDLGAPISGASVMLASGAQHVSRTATTDDAGTFRFDKLSAGAYGIGATDASRHAGRDYGQINADDAPTPIRLADGQRFDAHIALPRTGSISGVLLDDTGMPNGGAVYATAAVRRNGVLARQSVNVKSDADGHYRMEHLGPGAYVIAGHAPFTTGALRRMTPAFIELAARAVAHPDEPISAIDESSVPTFIFQTAYYNGATSEAAATPVRLMPGEDRRGIDLQLRAAQTTSIAGVLYDHRGMPDGSALIDVYDANGVALGTLKRPRPTGKDGEFRVTGILPGEYTLLVRHGVRVSPPGAPNVVAQLWGATHVTAALGAIAHARIDMSPGASVSGRIVLDSTPPLPTDFSKIRVELTAVDGLYRHLVTPGNMPSRIDRQGAFTISDVPPGTFAIRVTTDSSSPWVASSATVHGRDALGGPFTIEPGTGVDDAVITLTDRATEVSGTAIDIFGGPLASRWVAVFAAEAAAWAPPARRVAIVRTDANGGFTVRGLPPGAYLAAAGSGAGAPMVPVDAATLSALVDGATRFSLGEAEHVRISLGSR